MLSSSSKSPTHELITTVEQKQMLMMQPLTDNFQATRTTCRVQSPKCEGDLLIFVVLVLKLGSDKCL